MPEATFLCIDSSDFMRNGDYSPNRIMAVQESCSLLCEALMQRNPENVIGFLTFGGKNCSVRETLTEDIDRVSGSLASIAVGGDSHFAYGIQIAMLALSHVKNTRSQKQVVAFVGSPVTDSSDRLRQLATALRKDDVGVTIISLGVPANTPILQQFTEQIQKNANLYVVPEGGSVIDFLFTTAIMGGSGGASGGAPGGAGSVGVPGGFGPEADDPQFAMAIRASLEEEQRRQAAAASSTSGGGGSQQQQQQQTQVPVTNNQDAAPEDDLELALRLSMEEALRAEQEQNQAPQPTSSDAAPSSTPTTTSTTTTTTSTTTNNAAAAGGTTASNQNDMAEFEAAIQDPEVMRMLQQIAHENDDKPKNNSSGADKKDGDKK